MIYIVISNDNYYPGGGDDDWVYCGNNRDEAQAAFRAARGDHVIWFSIDAKTGARRRVDYR